MKQRIDLGAETVAFVRQRVAEIVGENQEGYKLSPSLRKHRRKQRRKIICDARSHREKSYRKPYRKRPRKVHKKVQRCRTNLT